MASSTIQSLMAKQAFKRGFMQGDCKLKCDRLKFFHEEGRRMGQMKAMQAAGVGTAFGIAGTNWEKAERESGRELTTDDVVDESDVEELSDGIDDAELDEADLDEADADEADDDESDDDEADEER